MKSKTLGIYVAILVAFSTLQNMALYGQTIEWQQDIGLAKQMAANENKLVLLHFTAEWCRPCKNMERFVFNSHLVEQAVNENVIPVKVDVDLHPEIVQDYAVVGVPYDVVITPAGRIVTRRNSPQTTDTFARMLKSLNAIADDLENGKTSVVQKLVELEDQLAPKETEIAEFSEFEPPTPSHSAPRIPQDAAQMARGVVKVLKNPYAEQKTNQANIKIKNEFITASTEKNSPKKIKTIVTPKQNGSQNIVVRNSSGFDPAYSSISENQLNTSSLQVAETQQAELSDKIQATQQLAEKGTDSDSVKTDNDATTLSGFALHGKCPVTLIMESKWVAGDQRWGCVHRGKTYLFASELHLREFRSDPDRFSPLLAGFDPVIYHEKGELVDGKEEHGVFMGQLPNQRVILFSSAESRNQFKLNSGLYINTIRQAMRSSTPSQETIMR